MSIHVLPLFIAAINYCHFQPGTICIASPDTASPIQWRLYTGATPTPFTGPSRAPEYVIPEEVVRLISYIPSLTGACSKDRYSYSHNIIMSPKQSEYPALTFFSGIPNIFQQFTVVNLINNIFFISLWEKITSYKGYLCCWFSLEK